MNKVIAMLGGFAAVAGTVVAVTPAHAVEAAKPKARTITVTQTSAFSSTMDRVQCELRTSGKAKKFVEVVCNADYRRYKEPARGTCGTKFTWAKSVKLDGTGKARFLCTKADQGVLITPVAPGPQVAWWNKKTDVKTRLGNLAPAAGSTFKAGDFRCYVTTKQVDCTNTKTKHGFSLSNDRYKLF